MAGFTTLDYAVLGAYIIGIVALGSFFVKNEKTTDDFFLAGRRIPWWAAGLSIFGTQMSAITYMSAPGKVYMSDWKYYPRSFSIVIMAPVFAYVFLPFFRRTGITSAYEYLEKRFNAATRAVGGIFFILYQVGRMGVVILLPALALRAVTGFNLPLLIILMGTLVTIYTVLGGIEAVIWTDVAQVIVLLGGAVFSLLFIVYHVPGGIEGIIQSANKLDKMVICEPGWFRWDLVGCTFWVILVGGLFEQFVPYGSDQAVIQRYLTVRSEAESRRGIWLNMLMSIPNAVMFFFIGTALFVYYQNFPERLAPNLKDDQIFAFFIVHELPPGLSGLLIAGIFAASMSTLDSSLNSVSTICTVDFYQKYFVKDREDHHYLNAARVFTVVLGIAATVFALCTTNAESLWDTFLRVMGLFGGPLAGLFLLGIVTRRANGKGALMGAVIGGIAVIVICRFTEISHLTYAGIGILVCFFAGYVLSFLFAPPAAEKVEKLVYWNL